MPGHFPIPMTGVRDIADVALRWLVRRDWRGIEGIAVHGPEDLSYNQAAAVMERILERPVRYQEASANDYVRTLIECGASVEYARSRVEMFSALAQGITRAEPRTAESTTATTLTAWAKRELPHSIESLRPRSETASAPVHNLSQMVRQNGNDKHSRSEYE
jgi:hypothetical protein